MPSQEDIEQQMQLLAIYRRNLAHELKRAAQYGGPARAPVEVVNGIATARAEIAGCKEALHKLGVVVDGVDDDVASIPQPQRIVSNTHAIAAQLASSLNAKPSPPPDLAQGQPMQSLIQLAARFRGFLGIVALLLVAGAFVLTFLFSQGSFDQILPGFLGLAPDQRFWLFLLALLLPFALICMLVWLSYRSSTPHVQRGSGVVTVIVHESGDRTRFIEGAEVRLALPIPQIQQTGRSGSVQLPIPVDQLDRSCDVNASKPGYKSRKTERVKLTAGSVVYLSLQPDPSTSRNTNQPPPSGPNAPANNTPDRSRSSASPFIIGPPVASEQFYGRVDLRQQLSDWLGGKTPQSCMLVGLYRSGKTSLLRYIRARPDEFFRPDQRPLIVSLDFAEATCRTPAGVIESLRRGLADQLGVEPWPAAENDDPHVVKKALERLRDQGRRLVVLVDEFQTIANNAADFMHWGGDWRSKMQSECLTCVIATLYPVSDVYRQAGRDSPFGNDLRDATIGALEPNDWRALVQDGMRAVGHPLRHDQLDLVDDLAGGLPFYTQMAGDAMLRHADPAAVRAAFAAAAAPHFAELWRLLGAQQRHALRAVANPRYSTEPDPGVRYALRARGLLRDTPERPFSSAFAAFIRDQP